MVTTEERPPNKKVKPDELPTKTRPTAKSSSRIKATSKVPAQRSRLLGRLADLMTMPVDVFTEICFYLFPIDLLHLSWSSKRLRFILMSKSARPIWCTARENQLPTLPPCPDDLSEPQYATLLFTTICQECGASRAKRTHFCLRTRHCVSCYPNYVGTSPHLINKYGRSVVAIARAAPHDETSRGHIHNLIALDTYHQEYWALRDESSRAQFIDSLQEKSYTVEKHAFEVSAWFREQSSIKVQQSEDAARSRLESIRKKLNELGWGDRDFPPSHCSEWTKLTQKSQALSEKVWKNLYPKLEPMLKTQRAIRIKQETSERRQRRMARIEQSYGHYRLMNALESKDLFYPLASSIFSVTSVKKLLDDDEVEDITTAQWRACIPELEDALRENTERVIREVKMWYTSEVLNSAKGIHSGSTSGPTDATMPTPDECPDMSLATAVFKCSKCKEALWLPNFYQHDHFVARYKWSPNLTQIAEETSDSNSPISRLLCYDAKSQAIVSTILAVSNVNPLTATATDVALRTGERYACARCHDDHQESRTFRELISHYMAEASWLETFMRTRAPPGYIDSHSIDTERGASRDPIFRVVGLLGALDLSANYRHFMGSFVGKEKLPGYNMNDYWSSYTDRKFCIHCHYESSGKDAIGQIVIHLKARHGIEVDIQSLDEVSDDLSEDEDEDEDGHASSNPFGLSSTYDPHMQDDDDDSHYGPSGGFW